MVPLWLICVGALWLVKSLLSWRRARLEAAYEAQGAVCRGLGNKGEAGTLGMLALMKLARAEQKAESAIAADEWVSWLAGRVAGLRNSPLLAMLAGTVMAAEAAAVSLALWPAETISSVVAAAENLQRLRM